MAGLGGKNWTFQEEVTSSDVNGYLADQVVMRFGGTAARDAGFGGSGEPTLAEGMVSYLDDANRVDYYNGSAWKPVSSVLQVVSTTKTDTFSASLSAATGTDLTGLTASITPSSTNHKVLVMVQTNGGISDGNVVYNGFQITRAGTAIGLGDADGNRSRFTAVGRVNANNTYDAITTTMVFLDSPSTTSSTTYGVKVFNATGGTRTIYVNRASYDGNDTDGIRVISTITLMEIAQ